MPRQFPLEVDLIATCKYIFHNNLVLFLLSIHDSKFIEKSVIRFKKGNLRNKHSIKCVYIQIFSGLYCPEFGLNKDIYFVNLCIQFERGKIRTTKTPNTDIFLRSEIQDYFPNFNELFQKHLLKKHEKHPLTFTIPHLLLDLLFLWVGRTNLQYLLVVHDLAYSYDFR